jgi:hypothetical protein
MFESSGEEFYREMKPVCGSRGTRAGAIGEREGVVNCWGLCDVDVELSKRLIE